MFTSKTFWGGVTGAITALSGYLTGQLEMAAALQLGFTSILAIFLKHAVAKNGTQ